MPDFSQSPKGLNPPTVIDHILLPVADLEEGARRLYERFGLRSYEFVKHGPFKLNGQRLLLRGTHRHDAVHVCDDRIPNAF